MPTYKSTITVRPSAAGNQETWGKSNVTENATGEHEDRRVLTIGTSEETFVINTDIGDAGICLIENLDATNFVKVGFSTGVYGIQAEPGIPQKFNLVPATSTLYLIADTAACNVRIHVLEA